MKLFTSKTQKVGEMGENLAVLFLMKQDFLLVERNIANKFGEIDIVAKKKGIYYFIEVKTVKNALFVIENLHANKMAKFLKSVEYYCFTHKKVGEEYRISAIIIELWNGTGEPKIEFIEHL